MRETRGSTTFNSRVAWLVMALAITSASVALVVVARLERDRVELEFREASGDVARRIQRDLHVIVTDLQAVRALFDVTPSVDRAAFAGFVRPLLARHPELTAIEWVARVRAADRAEYERRARADGLDLRVRERDESGRVTPAAPREEHYPVFYFEPRAGNESAFGLDLASGMDRAEALYTARDSGLPAIAGPLRLVQNADDPSGYLIIVPQYARGEHADPGAAQRESFAGVVLGVIRISRVFEMISSSLRERELEIAVEDSGRAIASHDWCEGEHRDGDTGVARFSVAYPLMFANRELTLRVTSTPAYYAGRVSPMPRLVAAGGGLLCVVLALYLNSLRRENVARARIDEALVESEHRYRTLVENAPDAVVVYDVDARRFVDANRKAATMLEVARERLLESSPLDVSPKLQPDGRESAAIVEDLVERTLGGENVVLPWNRRSPDGTEHPVELRLTPMPDASRRLIRCSVVDVRDRRQSELRQLMMARELDHRVKNNLATVLSIAEQTCASARSIEEFREAFVGRVRAMARTHEALAARRWDGVPLGEIAQLTLEPYVDGSPGRVTCRGEPVRLSSTASTCLCMAFHELAANAAKYGALSEPSGCIDLAWERATGGALTVEWTEREGPRVIPPTTAGFGSRMIKGVLSHELGGRATLEYSEGGICCQMTIPPEHWSVEGAKA